MSSSTCPAHDIEGLPCERPVGHTAGHLSTDKQGRVWGWSIDFGPLTTKENG